jgi:hypothetical protein
LDVLSITAPIGPNVSCWHECDLWAAPTNVRSWESNGLNADVAFGPFMHMTLALTPETEGQKTAQREIATALENALDARRQRIIVSQSEVNWVKWSCLFVQAACALAAIAMVHSDNQLASTITMGIFATGVAASILLILSHDRPFMGEMSVRPDPLLQVMPEAEASQQGMDQTTHRQV